MENSNENKLDYPTEWQDDDIMNVMMSPFRGNRAVNPTSWDAKVSFWKNCIFKICKQKNVAHFNTTQLRTQLIRNGQLPAGLTTVLEDMKAAGHVMSVEDYQNSMNSGWIKWCYNWLLYKPTKSTVSWLFGSSAERTEKASTEYFVMPLITEYSKLVCERWKSLCEKVTSHDAQSGLILYTELRDSCVDICSDNLTFDAVLSMLHKNKTCLQVISTAGERFVKFSSREANTIVPPTEAEFSIARLKAARGKLEQDVNRLTEEMAKMQLTAKQYLHECNKKKALTELRRKKRVEKLRDMRESAVEKLDVMLSNIEQAKSDRLVLDSLASGSATYKNLLMQYNLNTDSIDDIMGEVESAFDMHEEISDAMSQLPVDATNRQMTTEDLEEELNALTIGESDGSEQSSQMRSSDKLLNDLDIRLPNPPMNDPSSETWEKLLQGYHDSQAGVKAVSGEGKKNLVEMSEN